MGPDERLRRYQEVGADFIETARTRAEEFLRDIGALGEATGRQAGTTVGDLRDSGRRGTDQLFELIRREIAAQLSGLGLATKADLADLERRLTGGSGAAAPAGATKPAAAEKAAARKAATKKAATKKAATKKAAAGAAKKAPAARKAAAGKSTGASKSAAAKAASRTATAARKAVRQTGGTTS
jgi:polyhydroxyalkanoate synthesis regulator phasin